MSFERYASAGEVVKTVLATMGLPTPQVVSQATDATSKQMWALLSECGQDLLNEYNWRMLLRTMTITTVPGQLTYPLPADFQSFVDDTGWNNTSRVPLIGPMTIQQWRLLQARQLGGTTLRMQYIVDDGALRFYFVPSSPETLTIEYMGRGWVQRVADSTYADTVVSDDDTILFDRRLIIECLRHRWKQAKGFSTEADQQRFDSLLEASKYNDSPKNTLGLSGRSAYPYLGQWNLPDTRYGTS